MSDPLELYDIQALLALQAAFSRFGSDVQEGLASSSAQIRQTLEWLNHVINERKHQLEEARRRVDACEAALYRCANSGFMDAAGNYYLPNCSAEEWALQAARQREQFCQERLEKAYEWSGRVSAAVAQFEPQANALSQLASEQSAQAGMQLGILAQRYSEVHRGSSPILGTTTPVVASRPPTATRPVTPDGPLTLSQRGIRTVPMSDLPEISDLHGPQDFSKVSLEEMRAGILRLQEMLPTIQSGEGASSDYWADYDRARGLSYAQGYQRIFDAFYGTGAIRVERSAGRVDVINGRHRIWLARQMGIASLPVQLIET